MVPAFSKKWICFLKIQGREFIVDGLKLSEAALTFL